MRIARLPRASSDEEAVEAPAALPQSGGAATYTVTYAPSYEQSHALAKAADFDRRLVLLEQAIGITSSALPELENNGLPRAIMPTLDALQKQILTLSEASTSSLDSISRRVRTLTQEAEQLEKSRKAAKAAQDALASQGGGVSAADADDTEQTAKINALYGTLPTIESMTPLLPPLPGPRRLRALSAVSMPLRGRRLSGLRDLVARSEVSVCGRGGSSGVRRPGREIDTHHLLFFFYPRESVDGRGGGVSGGLDWTGSMAYIAWGHGAWGIGMRFQ